MTTNLENEETMSKSNDPLFYQDQAPVTKEASQSSKGSGAASHSEGEEDTPPGTADIAVRGKKKKRAKKKAAKKKANKQAPSTVEV